MKTGGRGKAGGVKLARSPQEAADRAGEILGMDIKGHTVHRVMVAQGARIAEEYYFSVLLDRSNRTFLAMASREGGMEIEQLAVERPDALARVPVAALTGIDEAKAREIVAAGKFPADVADRVAEVVVKLWDVFVQEDATLVEVNPLVKTEDGDVIALDGKVTLDENAGVPPARARRPRRHVRRGPAGGAGQGQAPQLRQARRRGRDHRQRRGPGDEHPRRRRLCR